MCSGFTTKIAASHDSTGTPACAYFGHGQHRPTRAISPPYLIHTRRPTHQAGGRPARRPARADAARPGARRGHRTRHRSPDLAVEQNSGTGLWLERSRCARPRDPHLVARRRDGVRRCVQGGVRAWPMAGRVPAAAQGRQAGDGGGALVMLADGDGQPCAIMAIHGEVAGANPDPCAATGPAQALGGRSPPSSCGTAGTRTTTSCAIPGPPPRTWRGPWPSMREAPSG